MEAASRRKREPAQAPDRPRDEWLTSLMGYHLRRAQVALFREFQRALGDIGLTQQQFGAVSLIGSNPGLGQTDVASILGSDRTTTTAIIDRLEERGYAVRKQSRVDRRRHELTLTKSGVEVLAKMRARISAHDKRTASMFTPQEWETLLRCLKVIYQAEENRTAPGK